MTGTNQIADRTTMSHGHVGNEKDHNANQVERMSTNDNDAAVAKVMVEAKVDEFGARSKTNPEEIALVRKLDRTILVRDLTNEGKSISLTNILAAYALDHVFVSSSRCSTEVETHGF